MSTNNHESDHVSLNPLIGCYKNGISLGCLLCIAITTSLKMGNRTEDRKILDLYLSVIEFRDGRWRWTGDILYNKWWADRIHTYKNPTDFFLSYASEIAAGDISLFVEIFEIIIKYPQHNFTFTTKLPDVLFEKVCKAEEIINKKYGISLSDFKNIKVAASIETQEYTFRINQLLKFSKFGWELELWFKPLLGLITGVSYKGISSIRINRERGCHKKELIRECKTEWIDAVFKDGKNQGIKVYWDGREDRMNRKEVSKCELVETNLSTVG